MVAIEKSVVASQHKHTYDVSRFVDRTPWETFSPAISIVVTQNSHSRARITETETHPSAARYAELQFGSRQDGDWLYRWNRTIDSFRSLEDGWDGYGCDPPSTLALVVAKEFLFELDSWDVEPARISPSVVNGVGFTFRNNLRKVYVEVYNDATVYALFSDGANVRTQPVRTTRGDFAQLICEIRAHLNV